MPIRVATIRYVSYVMLANIEDNLTCSGTERRMASLELERRNMNFHSVMRLFTETDEHQGAFPDEVRDESLTTIAKLGNINPDVAIDSLVERDTMLELTYSRTDFLTLPLKTICGLSVDAYDQLQGDLDY